VTNAARHAFRRHQAGSVTVEVCACDDTLQCAIIDDGAADGSTSPGRGTMIVDALVDELGGTISRAYSHAGSTIVFSVPLAEAVLLPRLATPRRIAPQNTLFGFLRINDQSDNG
jgi:two-component sensor histidine kinase